MGRGVTRHAFGWLGVFRSCCETIQAIWFAANWVLLLHLLLHPDLAVQVPHPFLPASLHTCMWTCAQLPHMPSF